VPSMAMVIGLFAPPSAAPPVPARAVHRRSSLSVPSPIVGRSRASACSDRGRSVPPPQHQEDRCQPVVDAAHGAACSGGSSHTARVVGQIRPGTLGTGTGVRLAEQLGISDQR
jgi:hypothetical protein